MSHRQTWPLSQDANKRSGVCSFCHEVRQLHLKDGSIHLHGPRQKPCPGSNKPPMHILNASNTPTQLLQPTTCVDPQAVNMHNQQVSVTPTGSYASTSSSAMDTLQFQPTDNQVVNNTSIASSISTVTTQLTTQAPPVVFSHPQVSVRLINYIPKSARPACATLLSTLLNKVTTNANDLTAWNDLFLFASRILHKPARTGKRHNLTSIIKKRTADGYINPSDEQGKPGNNEAKGRRRNAEELLAAAVAAKIEDGNIKAAVRLMSSEEKPATDIDSTYIKLLERHPGPSTGRLPIPDPSGFDAIQITEEEISKAVRTFPAGSSGGPDGLRPQHLLELVGCLEAGPALLTSLTSFTNMLLEGKCSPDVAPRFVWWPAHCPRKEDWGHQTHSHWLHTTKSGSKMCQRLCRCYTSRLFASCPSWSRHIGRMRGRGPRHQAIH